jgi:hypothetical protein
VILYVIIIVVRSSHDLPSGFFITIFFSTFYADLTNVLSAYLLTYFLRMILLRVVAFAMRYLVNNRFYIDNNLEGVDGSFYVLYEQLIALPA